MRPSRLPSLVIMGGIFFALDFAIPPLFGFQYNVASFILLISLLVFWPGKSWAIFLEVGYAIFIELLHEADHNGAGDVFFRYRLKKRHLLLQKIWGAERRGQCGGPLRARQTGHQNHDYTRRGLEVNRGETRDFSLTAQGGAC